MSKNINITVKLFATLRKDRFIIKEKKYTMDTTVSMVIIDLGIPLEEVSIIFINNKHAELDQKLQMDDVLALFPPIGGG